MPNAYISIHALREEGDLPSFGGIRGCFAISIHALREEGDPDISEKRASEYISIHALREEGDADNKPAMIRQSAFLSTPSARRATTVNRTRHLQPHHFYPRPPRGGRPPFTLVGTTM